MKRSHPRRDDRPSPKPKKERSGEAGRKSREHLPQALRVGGPVSAALQRSKSRAKKDRSLLHLWNPLFAELKRLRSHAKWEEWKPEQGAEGSQRIFRAILTEDRAGGENPSARLLRALLARGEGFARPEQMSRKAWSEYASNMHLYDLLLGDCIPDSIRKEVIDARYRANANQTALDDWPAFLDRLETVRARPMTGLATGLPTLDEATNGLQGVSVLAGETGVGKSSLALQMGLGVLRQNPDAAVLLYSLELPKDTFFTRLYSHRSGLPYRTVTRPADPQDRKRLEEAAEGLGKEILPRLRVVEWGSGPGHPPLTLDVMKQHVREMLGLPGVGHVLVVVDPLQRWEVFHAEALSRAGADGPTPRQLTELEAEDLRMRTLMDLHKWTRRPNAPAGEPVLAVSGVRKTDHSRRLTLADVRGSYNTVCEAHCVLLLEPRGDRSADGRDVSAAVLGVAKAREGRLGDIELNFRHTVSTFEERRPDVRGNPPAAPLAPETDPARPKRRAGK